MDEINFNSLEFNLYELLNLPINCTTEEVKKTFKRLIKKFHPDKITDVEEKLYYNITLANHILSNPVSRKSYDEWLLNSHKSHSTLKDNFNQELNTVKEYFPKTKEEAAVEFQNKFEMLGKRHGNYKEDSRSLQNIYNAKEKERGNVNITKEEFASVEEFNKTFYQRKKNGTYCNSIVKRNMDIQPFTFGNNNYAELKDFENVYTKDNQLKYAFELIPVDEESATKKTVTERMDDYTKVTNSLKKNKKTNQFGDLDF